MRSIGKYPEEVCYEECFPEILNLCEVQKFCDDPASRPPNWYQVERKIHQHLNFFRVFVKTPHGQIFHLSILENKNCEIDIAKTRVIVL